jgi:hypothetical protein
MSRVRGKQCPQCKRESRRDANFCYNCGRLFVRQPPQLASGLDRNGDVLEFKPRRERQPRDAYAVSGADLSALLKPLIDLNGKVWVAGQMGIDESRLRKMLAQRHVELSTVDKRLTAIGLSHALSDGTLNIVSNPRRIGGEEAGRRGARKQQN